jgi:hypothetical protein
VKVVRSDGSPLVLWHTSYVEWAIWTLLRRVTAFRAAQFDPRSGLAGPAILAPAYARLEELAEDVWRMREPGFSRTDARPADPDMLLYRSMTRYFEFARSLPDAALARLNPPASAHFVVDAPDFDLDLHGFRVFEPSQDPGGPLRDRYALGRLDGADAWVETTSSVPEVLVRFNPQDEARVRGWLEERGLPILSEEPMSEGYDAMGW